MNADLDSDWAVTALFYAALHYVDAYLARRNMYPAMHEHRDRMLQADVTAARVRANYRRLKDRSVDARYNGAKVAAPVLASLRTKDLEPIKLTLNP